MMYEKRGLDHGEWITSLMAYFEVDRQSGMRRRAKIARSNANEEHVTIDEDLLTPRSLSSITTLIQWASRLCTPMQITQLAVHTIPLNDVVFVEMVKAKRYVRHEDREALDVPLLRIVTTSGTSYVSDLTSRRQWQYIMVRENLMRGEYYFELWEGLDERGTPKKPERNISVNGQATSAIKLPQSPSLWHYLDHTYASLTEWLQTNPHHWSPAYFTKFNPIQVSYGAVSNRKIGAILRDSFVKVKIGYKNREDWPVMKDGSASQSDAATDDSNNVWILNGVLLDASDREEVERCVNTFWNGSEWEMNITFPESGEYLLRVDACSVPRHVATGTTPRDSEWFCLGSYSLDTDVGIDSLATQKYCKLYPEIDTTHWMSAADAIVEPEIGAFQFSEAPVSFVFRSSSAVAAYLVNQHTVIEMKQKGKEFFANESIQPGGTQLFVTREEGADPVLLCSYRSNVHQTHSRYEPKALRHGVRLIDMVSDSYERQLRLTLPSQFKNLKCHLQNVSRDELRHDAVFCTRHVDEIDILTKLPSQGEFAVKVFGDCIEKTKKQDEKLNSAAFYVPKSPKLEILAEDYTTKPTVSGQNDAVTINKLSESDSEQGENNTPSNLLYTHYFFCNDDNHEMPTVRQIFPVQHPAFFEYLFELLDPLNGELEAAEHTFDLRTPMHDEILEVCLQVPNSSIKPQIISSDSGQFSSGWSGFLLQQDEEKKVRQSASVSVTTSIDRQKTLHLVAKTKSNQELPLLTFTVLIDEVLVQHQDAPDHNEMLATISER